LFQYQNGEVGAESVSSASPRLSRNAYYSHG
jgi:hypothetical protein